MVDSLRARIVAGAREMLGTPWVHQHRSHQFGVDCAGVVTMTAKKLGLSAFDMTAYERMPDGLEMLAVCDAQMTRIPVGSMQAGDAVCLQFTGQPQHIGVLGDYVYGGLSLIHANNRIGKVVEHRLTDDWRRRIVAAYRLPGVPE